MLAQPAVDYVSVKISSICSQLDVLRFDHEVERIAARLRRLYDAANSYRPAKFVNLDMEEYRDLELTLAVFRRVLDEPAYAATGGRHRPAGLPAGLAAGPGGAVRLGPQAPGPERRRGSRSAW